MIKKETRILGLSAPTGRLKRIPVVGIVFRGSLWLDGILTCELQPDGPAYLSGLVRTIVRSRQYSQIRAAILSREDLVPGIRIDISAFSRKINLPVVSIIRKTDRWKTPTHQNELPPTKSKIDYFSIKIAGGLVRVKATGISREETREIFAVACANGQRIPEAVRVAEVVAEHVTRRSLFPEIK